MDKTVTIKSVTKGDINDLKAYANAIGVKCENCIFSQLYKGGEYFCNTFGDYLKKEEFCSYFRKKETNEH